MGSRAIAIYLVVPGGLPGTSGSPIYSGTVMLASQVDLGLELPLMALGEPVTTYPESQDRAPGLLY